LELLGFDGRENPAADNLPRHSYNRRFPIPNSEFGMALEYVNRRGDHYYVQQGLTKTGKPKYFSSKKPGESPLDAMPEGYEFRENPADGMVSLRKVRPSAILPIERQLLERLLDELSTVSGIVDLEEDSLVVYTSGIAEEEAAETIAELAGPGINQRATQDYIRSHALYHPMLRFRLTAKEERLYSADRWCFLGSIDDWYPIAVNRPLDALAKELLPHLGGDSFFELV
jgi:hypothetical protein